MWSGDFWFFGEALAKEHARSGLRLSRNEAKNQKDRFSPFFTRMAAELMKML
jgi:hypothetical protein